MPNLNQCNFMGLLTRDPETRTTPNGSSVTDIAIAVNRSWKDDSGQKQEETCYVDCTAFGRTAQIISQYVKKASPVFVSGHLIEDTWTDKASGQQRSKLKLVIENLQLLGGKPEAARSQSPATRNQASATRPAPQDLNQEPSDIPF